MRKTKRQYKRNMRRYKKGLKRTIGQHNKYKIKVNIKLAKISFIKAFFILCLYYWVILTER